MLKTNDISFSDQLIDDTEISLFEPECIITDSTKDITFLKLDDRDIDPSNCHRYSTIGRKNIKVQKLNYDENIGQILDQSHHYIHKTNLQDETVDALKVYVENMQMHSIFTPDNRTKPKEVFTQCRSCEKYVIIRMNPETGIYSLCTQCFNDPFDSITIEKPVSQCKIEYPLNESTSHIGSRSDGSFGCDRCGKVFTRNWYLKQHIKLHLNEKPFSCDRCDKRFLNSSNLKQHMRTHSIEYRCDVCKKTCISRVTLDEHKLKHASNDTNLQSSPLPSTKTTEKQNEQIRTAKDVYQCSTCQRVFRYHAILMKHVKSHE